jgi:hypothetical protein
VLKGETYCYRCHSYISKDGTRGGESSWDVSEDREFDNALEDPDEFESEREEESDQFDW